MLFNTVMRKERELFFLCVCSLKSFIFMINGIPCNFFFFLSFLFPFKMYKHAHMGERRGKRWKETVWVYLMKFISQLHLPFSISFPIVVFSCHMQLLLLYSEEELSKIKLCGFCFLFFLLRTKIKLYFSIFFI